MRDTQVLKVLLDANVIIDLIRLGVLSPVTRISGLIFHITQEVAAEIERPGQRTVLDAAINIGRIQKVRLESPACLDLFFRLRKTLGAGEAPCISYAKVHGYDLLSDEKDQKFMREVVLHIGQESLMRCEGLLVLAIQARCLSLRNLENRIRKLSKAARSHRDRDAVNHLKRVVERVSLLLKGRTKS